MKSIKYRFILITIFAILISSLLSLSITTFITDICSFYGITLPKLFGVALKELLSPAITAVISCVSVSLLSRSVTEPVIELTEATKKIAQGDFDVSLKNNYSEDEFEQLSENFNLMVSELKSNEYLRKNFVSNVSHEFKTPVAVISGYIKLIDDPSSTPEERSEYCKIIENECEKLTTLSKNLLSLSRLENQSIPTARELFRLDEQLRQCIIRLEPKWSKKSIDFNIDTDRIFIRGSESLMMQVWTNLIDNAIKFSNNNGIITVTAHETDSYIIVTVEDRGIGMTEEVRDRVFERFFQGDTSHKEQGNGLGLSIVKSIVEKSGGTISVESTLGRGSKFTVKLFKPKKSEELQSFKQKLQDNINSFKEKNENK